MNKKYVVDVGMHDGKDSEYYAKRGYHVIAFEANPELCAIAAENLKLENIEIVNRAISDLVGTTQFYINSFNSAWSSLDSSLGNRREGSKKISVDTINLSEALSQFSMDIEYVKIDIEGYDLIALRQVLGLDKMPNYISVENGSAEMIKMMRDAGYGGFKFSNQKYVQLQRVPTNSPHGHMVDHIFKPSSSGLFGEDLPGRWFTYDEALKTLEGLAYGRRVAADNLWAETVGWFDLHAKRQPDESK